jgi:hypothetical protein
LRAFDAYLREQLAELGPGDAWRTELRRVMESLYADDSEVVPGLVELEVAVPHLSPAVR